MFSHCLRFVSGVVLSAGVALAAQQAAAEPTRDPLNFIVLRNGETVGSHTVRFQPISDGTAVTIDTNVVVKIAMIPVYRFEHHGQEVWQGGQLTALNSTTHDDGTNHTLKVARTQDKLDVTGDGNRQQLSGVTFPASLWNRSSMSEAHLMNTLDGHLMGVSIADQGDDTVTVHGKPTNARHYSMTGDLARELWYDASGTLVQVRFKAKDDSDIRYVLK